MAKRTKARENLRPVADGERAREARGERRRMECVLTPTSGQAQKKCAPFAERPLGDSSFLSVSEAVCARRTFLLRLSVCSRKHCISIRLRHPALPRRPFPVCAAHGGLPAPSSKKIKIGVYNTKTICYDVTQLKAVKETLQVKPDRKRMSPTESIGMGEACNREHSGAGLLNTAV